MFSWHVYKLSFRMYRNLALLLNKKKKRFKYYFGPQSLTFASNWSLAFQHYQIGTQPFNIYCAKRVFVVKCLMENADRSNFFFFLILKMSDVACQLKF